LSYVQKTDSVRDLVKLIFDAAEDTKAIDISVLDLRGLSAMADYLLICSGSSNRQVQAISDRVTHMVKSTLKRNPLGVEGLQNSFWVLVDYGDVVCHFFTEEAREFYHLENLWHDAKEVSFYKPIVVKKRAKQVSPKKKVLSVKKKVKPTKKKATPGKKKVRASR